MHAGAVEPRRVGTKLGCSRYWINRCSLLYIGACAIVYRIDLFHGKKPCALFYIERQVKTLNRFSVILAISKSLSKKQ